MEKEYIFKEYRFGDIFFNFGVFRLWGASEVRFKILVYKRRHFIDNFIFESLHYEMEFFDRYEIDKVKYIDFSIVLLHNWGHFY